MTVLKKIALYKCLNYIVSLSLKSPQSITSRTVLAPEPPSAYNFPCIFIAFSVLVVLLNRKSNCVNHFTRHLCDSLSFSFFSLTRGSQPWKVSLKEHFIKDATASSADCGSECQGAPAHLSESSLDCSFFSALTSAFYFLILCSFGMENKMSAFNLILETLH